MSDLPARIWLTYEIANVHWLAFDEAPTDPHDNARDEYVRADLADAWAKERDRLRADLAAAQEREMVLREALEEIDAVAVDHGHYETAARTMHEIALSAMRGEP